MRVVAVVVATLLTSVAATAGSSYVSPAQTVTSAVNIRVAPSDSSEVIDVLRPEMARLLIMELPGWYQIKLNSGRTGFVSKDWTQITTAAVSPTNLSERPPVTGPAKTEPGGLSLNAENSEPAYAAVAAESVPPKDRSTLIQAKELILQKRQAEAFAMLAPLEPEWAGDAGFDYLYGVAALGTEHADEAIFALERVTRSLPDFVSARLDLARALYLVADHQQARKELVALLEMDLNPEARGIVQSYLDAIDAAPIAQKQSDQFYYASATAGYDSNANGAADIDSFKGFTLDPRSSEVDSTFLEAQFGAFLRRPLKAGLNISWRGDLKHRHNNSAEFVNQGLANTTVALEWKQGKHELVGGLAAYWSALDGGFNERSAALSVAWQRLLEDNNVLQLAARAGPVRFTDAQKVRNVQRLLYTVSVRQPIQGGSGEMNWTAVGGRDLGKDRSSPYSNVRIGARLGLRWKASGNDMMFDLGKLRIPFNGNRNFFGIDRKDDQYTASFAAELRNKPFQGWNTVPNIRYVKNSSNVSLFDYDRTEVGIMFRVSR